MRVSRVLLRSAAAAGLASFAAACVIPPAGLTPRPEELALGAPEVALYSFDSPHYGAGAGLLAYSLSRDAYVATFEVDQQGRVRILTPTTPKEDGRAEGGRSYVVSPRISTVDRGFLPATRDFDRVPFVFALTSDSPLDLSAFERGGTWSRSLAVRGYEPDSVAAAVADRVLRGDTDYAFDYAYVGPRLRGDELAFVSECARPIEDVHDYRYYRELWAVFTPQDQRLSYNPAWFFTPVLGWSTYNFLPFAAYRAQIASNAFYGACSPPAALYTLRYAGYGPYTSAGLYGYPYGAYGYGRGSGYAAAPAARPWPAFRPPQTPLAFTNPVAVTPGNSTGNTAVAAQTGGRRVNTGPWILGQRPAWLPGAGQPSNGQTALMWRPAGGTRLGVFNPEARRGGGAEQRPIGMGYVGRGAGMPPSAGHAPGSGFGQAAGHAAGQGAGRVWAGGSNTNPAFGAGGASDTHAAPSARPSAAATVEARSAEKGGSAAAAPQ